MLFELVNFILKSYQHEPKNNDIQLNQLRIFYLNPPDLNHQFFGNMIMDICDKLNIYLTLK